MSPGTLSHLSDALRTVLLEIAHGDIARIEAYPARDTRANVHRRSIGDVSGAVSVRGSAPISPETSKRREELENLVVDLWSRCLGVPPRHMREDFFDAGGDSLLAVRLIAQLCRHLDRKLPVALFLKDPTAGGLVNGLLEDDAGDLDYAIAKLADGDDGRVLFVSMGQAGLDELVAAMRPGPRVYRLDAYFLQEQQLLAGRPLFESVEAIAAQFRQRLKAVQPKGPYLLAGGCEGSVLFYELALQLRRQGDEVAFLAVLDTPVRGFWEYPTFLESLRRAKHRFRDIVERHRPQSKTPEYLRIWATIWQAIRLYQPGSRFDGDVHQFRATKQRFGVADVVAGWDRRVTGRVVVHSVPGDHRNWITNPQGGATVSTVMDAIAPAPVSSGSGQ